MKNLFSSDRIYESLHSGRTDRAFFKSLYGSWNCTLVAYGRCKKRACIFYFCAPFFSAWAYQAKNRSKNTYSGKTWTALLFCIQQKKKGFFSWISCFLGFFFFFFPGKYGIFILKEILQTVRRKFWNFWKGRGFTWNSKVFCKLQLCCC